MKRVTARHSPGAGPPPARIEEDVAGFGADGRLADGLAYAEIARRLYGPTATITREVMRSGGATELWYPTPARRRAHSPSVPIVEARPTRLHLTRGGDVDLHQDHLRRRRHHGFASRMADGLPRQAGDRL